MLSGGPNYTSLLIGGLLGFGLIYLSRTLRRILTRKPATETLEDPPALETSGRLNVRFALGAVQSALLLCIVLAFLPTVLGFRGEGVTWKGFALLLLFNIMLGSAIAFALRKKDLSWAGNWVDPERPSDSSFAQKTESGPQ